jgi:hypothetical protein
LLALAPQFEPLFAEWQHRRMIEWGEYCEIESRTKAALGPAASKPSMPDPDHPYYLTRHQVIEALDFPNDNDEGDDRLFNRIHAFAEEVLSWEAETMEGLGFQIRVMMCAYPDIWEPTGYDDDAPDDGLFARVIEDICRLCGIKFPPTEQMPAAVTFAVDETPAVARPTFPKKGEPRDDLRHGTARHEQAQEAERVKQLPARPRLRLVEKPSAT